MKLFKTLIVLIAIFSFKNSMAIKWYVDEGSNTADVYTAASIAGNDVNVGDANNPWATMAFAIATANPFDTIYVDAGTYNQQYTISKSITIIGASATLTVFDGANKTLAGGNCITLASNISVRISNITVTHYNQGMACGVFGTPAAHVMNVRLLNNRFSDNFSNGIYINTDCHLQHFEAINCDFNTNDGAATARGLYVQGQNKDTMIVNTCNFISNKFIGFDFNIPLSTGTNNYTWIKHNTVTNHFQPAIALIGFQSAIIDSNLITDAGHCAIELKTCKGNGNFNGAGSFVVSNNIITRTTPNIDTRDICGIGVINRDQNTAGASGTINTSGIIIINNEISNYTQLNVAVTNPPYTAGDVTKWAAAPFNGGIPNVFFDAIGIVVEGQNHRIFGNKIVNCEVGLLIQERPITTANTTPPISDYFDANRCYVLSTANTILNKNGFIGCTTAIRGIGLTSILNASNSYLGQNTPAGAMSAIVNLQSATPLAFPAITPPLTIIPSSVPTGMIDYTPWLKNATDAAPIGFQGDYSYLVIDDDSPQTLPTKRLQEGHDSVSGNFPLIVEISSGFYIEKNTVSKTVRYSGQSMPIVGHIQMNGTADTLTVISPFYIADSLVCKDGLINTTLVNSITLKDTAGANLGTLTSYINGPLKQEFQSIATASLNLPIGKQSVGNRYAVFNFNQTSATLTTYVAEYFATGAPTLLKNTPISPTWIEQSYWKLDNGNTSSFTNPTLTLNYNTNDYPAASQHSIVKNDHAATPAWATLSELNPTWTATSGTVATSPLQNSKFTTLGEFAIAPISICATTSFTSSNSACLGDSVSFVNTTSILAGQHINSYTWNFGDGTALLTQAGPFSNPLPTNNPSVPKHHYLSAGTYTVKLISVGSSGCKDSITHVVTIHALPIITITPKDTIRLCLGDSTLITSNSNATSVLWNTGSTATAIYIKNQGTYFATATSTASCKANSDTVYIITQNCTAQIALAKTNDSPQLQADGSYQVHYLISISNLGNDTLKNIQVIEHLNQTFPVPCTYIVNSVTQSSGSFLSINNLFNGNTNVNLIASSNNTLLANQTSVIDIFVSFTPNGIYTFSNSVSGTGTGHNGTTTDVSTNGTNPDPNGNGNPNDAGEDASTVFTVNTNLVIPTGFSPNGDGVNDNFQLQGIETYAENSVTIFNRWGNVVYKKNPYTNTEAWDGTLNSKGANLGSGKVQNGTYYYVIILDSTTKPITGFITISY